MSRWKIWSFFGIALCFFSGTLKAAEYHALLVFDPSSQIDDLIWPPTPDVREPPLYPCRNMADATRLWYCVKLKGKLSGQAQLLYKEQPLDLSPEGFFEKEILLDSNPVTVSLKHINIKGNVQTEKVTIVVPQGGAPPEAFLAPSVPSQFDFAAGLGVTYSVFHQLGVPVISQVSQMLKAGANYRLQDRWSFGANVFYTPFQYTSQPKGFSLDFLGGNVRAGYTVTQPKSRWVFTPYLGWYYNTSFSHPVGFGYQDLQGPQIFPTLTRLFENNQKASIYLKYSPILSNLSFLNADNGEFAFGGSYSFPVGKGNSIAITLDLAYLQVLFPNQVGILDMTRVTSCSLGGTFQF